MQNVSKNILKRLVYRFWNKNLGKYVDYKKTMSIITPKNWTKNEVRYSYSKGVRYIYEKHNKKKLQSSF